MASKSISSASKVASKVLSSASSTALSSLSAASASASAATDFSSPPTQASDGLSTTSKLLLTVAALITVTALVLTTIYIAGYGDDIASFAAQRYYKGKAVAQVKVLQNVGSEKVEGALKDSLKNNPVLGEDELEQVSSGLGKEAVQEGLGGVSDTLGGLGKL